MGGESKHGETKGRESKRLSLTIKGDLKGLLTAHRWESRRLSTKVESKISILVPFLINGDTNEVGRRLHEDMTLRNHKM